jgi:hypothetical protein
MRREVMLLGAVLFLLGCFLTYWFYPPLGMPSFAGMSREEITTWTFENIPAGGNTICTKPAMYIDAGANCGGRQHFMYWAFKGAGYPVVRANNSEHSIVYSEGCWYDASFGNWSCDAEQMAEYGPYPPFPFLGGWRCTDVSR